MVRTQRRFFVGISLFLLAIVLVGFSRTFYLRAFFDVPPLPLHVYVHAILLTGWFVWLVMQASLVASGRIDLHRQLGVAGACLGAAIVAMNVVTVVAVGPRLRAVFAAGKIDPEFLIRAIWGDIVSVITFATFLTLAVWLRRRPEAHKRLVLLASFSIIAPALGRIAHWPSLEHVKGLTLILTAGAMVLLLGALVAYDLITRRRLHPATLFGGAARVAAWFATGAIASSEFGRSVIFAMSR